MGTRSKALVDKDVAGTSWSLGYRGTVRVLILSRLLGSALRGYKRRYSTNFLRVLEEPNTPNNSSVGEINKLAPCKAVGPSKMFTQEGDSSSVGVIRLFLQCLERN